MERKDRIYAYMADSAYVPLTLDELALVLDVPPEDTEEFQGVLESLVREGKIFLTKRNRFAVCEKNNVFHGTLHVAPRSGAGFVECDGLSEDIFVRADALNTAMDGDSVLVRRTGRSRGRDEGIVISVTERSGRAVSAVITDDFNAVPDNPRIGTVIKLTELSGAKNGDRVLVTLTDFKKNGSVFGEVTAVLGNSRDIKSLTAAIIAESRIKTEFDAETLAEADVCPAVLSDFDHSGRTDFRRDTIFTIDGDGARDFDDAVSVAITENGNFRLGVHISDVTHYVKENTALWREAYTRGTSVYLADRVIPMLPEKLSNGICSLNPHEDRLTLSLIMEIDRANGNVLNNTLHNGIICSCERMTYNDTEKILCGDTELREKYAHILPDIENMHKLAQLLHNRRRERGSINFDFPEAEIILDGHGMPCAIEKEQRGEAHKMIEEFMLIANETIAELAFWADIPFIYRVHDTPTGEKIDSFRKFIGSFGYVVKGKELHPKDLQRILDQSAGTEHETMLSAYLLRSLMKAEYRTECSGHFGLSAKYYCHFTSPIRRLPDLIIHRILKDFISGADLSHYARIADTASARSSETERTAELCERDVSDLFKTAYISQFVGQTFPAVISGVTDFGIFAELENTVEGLIRLESIRGDYYEYDDTARCIFGKRHGRTFRIGDKIEVEVTRADLLTRQIDFVLAGSRLKPPPKRRKHHRNRRKL